MLMLVSSLDFISRRSIYSYYYIVADEGGEF